MPQEGRVRDPERCVLEIVSHHHLEEVADDEAAERCLPLDVLEFLRSDLSIKLVRLHDRTSDQVGEKRFKERSVAEVLHEVATHNARLGIPRSATRRPMAAK